MGVLSCNVKGCTNIMCTRHSHEYGYICDECFDILITLGTEVNLEDFFEGFVELEIKEDAHSFYNELFPVQT